MDVNGKSRIFERKAYTFPPSFSLASEPSWTLKMREHWPQLWVPCNIARPDDVGELLTQSLMKKKINCYLV